MNKDEKNITEETLEKVSGGVPTGRRGEIVPSDGNSDESEYSVVHIPGVSNVTYRVKVNTDNK